MTLLLITNRFPFDIKFPFLSSEIFYLAEKFDKVNIVPLYDDLGQLAFDLPDNVNIIIPKKKYRIRKNFNWHNLHKIIFYFMVGLYYEWNNIKDFRKFFTLQNFKESIVRLNLACNYYEGLEEVLIQKGIKPDVIYSYWNDAWLLSAIWLNKRFKWGGKIISRVHGYDLYFERSVSNYQPFFPYILKKTEGIYAISDQGSAYLKDKMPWANNINVAKLGVMPPKEKNKPSSDAILRIVSCAKAVPVKRIELLIKALKKTDIAIEWNHFGSGDLIEDLQKQAAQLPDNVSSIFHGFVTNNKVMAYYENNAVDLFINTSEFEGIPVSIMEASSYGIPVIATDVGGTSEIVNCENGYLLQKDFKVQELTELIKKFSTLPKKEVDKKREAAYAYYFKNFNAEKNFREFAERLYELAEKTTTS